MRVLHVGKALPPVAGGMETYLGDLLRAQARMGLQVAALVHAPPGAQPPDPADFGGARVYTSTSHGQLLYAPVSPGFPLALRAAIRDFAPDVLHLHVPNTSAFAALVVPAARRLPWVLHWHADVDPAALDWRLRWAYRFYQPFEAALLRRAARIVVTSAPYRDASPALRPWRARCEVIPLGVDLSRLPDVTLQQVEGARALWPSGGPGGFEGPRVLAVGRLAYYKGFEVLIEAMQHLPAGSLLVVGEGPRRSMLEQRIRTLGLDSRVRMGGAITGRRGEVGLAPIFAACDVLCLPSLDRSEAFGLVLLEARRYGSVLVASDVPGSGVGWVVDALEGGHLVPAGDARALAAALHIAGRQAQISARVSPFRTNAVLPAWCSIDHSASRLADVYAALTVRGGQGRTPPC